MLRESIGLTRDQTQDYFQRFHHYKMVYPDIPGVVVVKKDVDGQFKSQDIIPFELLYVDEGQLYRKKLDPSVVAFVQREATKRPELRKEIIERCLEVRRDIFCAHVALSSFEFRVSLPEH